MNAAKEQLTPGAATDGGTESVRKAGLRVVLCTGMKRSASTWSYNVCREILGRESRATGVEFAFDYCNDTDSLVSKLIAQLNASPRPMILLLKAHSPGPKTRALIAQGRIANIFTLRDPRDAFASMIKFLPEESGIEQNIRWYKRELRLGEEFATGMRSLMVRYERMMAEPQEGIAQIAHYLGYPLSDQARREIDDATNMEASRKIAEAVAAKKKSGGSRRADRATQIHANHIQGGTVGRWRDELSPEVTRRLDAEWGHWLAMFGYDKREDD